MSTAMSSAQIDQLARHIVHHYITLGELAPRDVREAMRRVITTIDVGEERLLADLNGMEPQECPRMIRFNPRMN